MRKSMPLGINRWDSHVDPFTHGCVTEAMQRADIALLERQIRQIEAREPDALTGPALEALRNEVKARRAQIKVSVLEQ